MITLAGLVGAGEARASVIVFDFEDRPATFIPPSPRPGALTSLSITESGLTILITRPGSVFDIVANIPPGQGKSPEFGLRSLDPFAGSSPTVVRPLLVNFSAPVTSVSVLAGDYGQDQDTIDLRGFSGPDATGAPLASTTAILPGSPGTTFTFTALTITAPSSAPFHSISLIGGSSPGFSSVFYDNLTVVAVPEPSTLALGLVGLGLAGAGWARSRPARR